MAGLLKKIALLFPVVREHVENVNALIRQRDGMNVELAARQNELDALKQHLAVLERQFDARIGAFFPDAKKIELTAEEKQTVEQFKDLYYWLGQQGHFTYFVSWLGYSTLKCPLDLWMYQELICKLRPEVIVETGTASGGSALFLASMCDFVGQGQVITIDVDPRHGEALPVHARLSYVVGSSTDPVVIDGLRKSLQGKRCSMIILDSDHRKDHVLAELRVFQEFVPVGGYLVVEDTNINGHPSYPEFGPGPMEALEEFLSETDAFETDPTCERFLLTMNPKGYLRRVK